MSDITGLAAAVSNAGALGMVPPAQLTLATILQAYTGASDDEVVEATVMDRRWQLVLDCMNTEEPPFSTGTLVGCRKRLIEKNLDRRLVEQAVEPGRGHGRVRGAGAAGSAVLQPAVGAGRVEDTFILMGHALRKALGVIAVLQWRGQTAGIAVVAAQAGHRSWPPPARRRRWMRTGMTRPPGMALARALGLLDQVRAFVAGQAGEEAAAAAVAAAQQSVTWTWTWLGRRRRCAAGSPEDTCAAGPLPGQLYHRQPRPQRRHPP